MKKLLILLGVLIGNLSESTCQVIYSSDSVIVPAQWLKITKQKLNSFSILEKQHAQLSSAFDSINRANFDILNSTARIRSIQENIMKDRDKWKDKAHQEQEEVLKLEKQLRNTKKMLEKSTHEVVKRRAAESLAIKYYRVERPALIAASLLWLPVFIIIKNNK